MAKIEWARREASRLGNTQTPSPDDVASKIGRFSVSPSHSLVTETVPKKVEAKIKEANTEILKAASASPTPVVTPTTPPSLSSSHPKVISITADSIQPIPPFKARKSKEWSEGDSYHLTIGPTGGAEWSRRLKEESDIHRSTDCITSKSIPDLPAQDSSSSDSDLLRGSSPVWPPRPRSGRTPPSMPPKIIPLPMDTSLSDSARSVSSQEAEEQAKAEELAAKKTRVKQSLMKRARSVAIFSLKLKERRAREAAEKASKQAVTPSTPLPPPQCGGGELSCIPIEKLIQLDDLRKNQQQRNSQSGTL
ncbi:hypothetical protein QE152_g33945 [Popillia japonica]|uniref:Uncharacterized protein n=1 Tax=Popillia japonica TaxID=7064 RepID=A0AAW1IUZ7_POPJA